MSGSVLWHATSFIFRSTLRNRAALALTLVAVALAAASVGTRIGRFLDVVGTAQPKDIKVLVEEPTPERVTTWAYQFQMGHPLPTHVVEPSLLFAAVADRSDFSAPALDGVLLFAFALAALFVGVGLSPGGQGPSLTLLSAPVRKTTLYLAHALALLGYVVFLCAAAWGACALVLVAAFGAPQAALGQLSRVFLFALPYVAALSCMGLCLGVLFRGRAAALVAGTVLVVFLTTVCPNLFHLMIESYTVTHREEIIRASQSGSEPRDLAYVAVKLVRHTPANALSSILHSIAPATCSNCRGSSARETPSECLALGAAALVPLLLGGVVFARREVTDA